MNKYEEFNEKERKLSEMLIQASEDDLKEQGIQFKSADYSFMKENDSETVDIRRIQPDEGGIECVNSTKGLCFYFLLLTIVLLLLIGIYMFNEPITLTGTYCTSKETHIGENLYLVIEKNGEYMLYEQYFPIEKGNYEKIEEKLFLLSSQNGETHQIYFKGDDTAYYVSDSEIEIKFYKISELPIYINIEE